jgi:clan AA aspartic protease (TIGR02281 family)
VRDAGGMIQLQAVVDGVPMEFALDSGASGVSIPQEAFDRLQREGRITEADYRHQVDVTLANGQHERVRVYMLHQISIGGRTLFGLECLIGKPGSSYLLGENVLQQFGSVTIDNRRGILRLEG